MREGEGESERAREKKAEVAREGRTEVVDEVNGTGEPREGKNNSNGAELDLETQMRAVAQLKSFAMSCVSALLPSSGAKDRGKVEGEGSREDTRGSDRRGNERSGGK